MCSEVVCLRKQLITTCPSINPQLSNLNLDAYSHHTCTRKRTSYIDVKKKLCFVKLSSVFFYLGQHNDARMNLAIALTAVRHGASVANHVEVLSLLKKKGKMYSADPLIFSN